MVAPEALRGAFRYCRWICRRSGSHFVSSFRILPRVRREGMEAVYAFCRAVDDVVDREGAGEGPSRRELERWRQELRAGLDGSAAHPIGVAVGAVCRRFDLSVEWFEKVIDGVEMDLRPQRFDTFGELKGYCDRVASAVGRICVRVFGCRHPAAEEYADALGIAFQLTNILRDLTPDAWQGRFYLPQEDLGRFGITEAELRDLSGARSQTWHPSDSFRKLMSFECERARLYFRRASEACRRSGEGRRLLPARIMAAVYFQLLQEIERSGDDLFSKRISVSKPRQFGLALRCLFASSS